VLLAATGFVTLVAHGTIAIEPEQRLQVQEFQRKHRIGLLTLFFSDIVGSTELKQRWGDPEAIAMIQWHHAVAREILGNFKEGELISTAGDSCFLVFAKPSDGVKFSLLLQAKLRAQALQTGKPLFDRIGIHVGEVLIEEAEEGQNRGTSMASRSIPARALCRSAGRIRFSSHALLSTAPGKCLEARIWMAWALSPG